MAIFNPSVPQTNDPNFLNLSKSITTPEADKSSAFAFNTAGNVIEGAAKGADTLMKKSIDAELHDKVDNERGAYTEALQFAENQVNSKALLPGADDTNQSANVPSDLKALPGAVSSLTGARANGRLSETYYYGRLDALAKDFRARYPGYRDYIDSKISEITGVNPANAYVKSLIGDINAATTNQQRYFNDAYNDLRSLQKEGNVQASQELKILMQTGNIDRANNFVSQSKSTEWELKNRQNDQQNVKLSTESKADAAKGEFSLMMSDMTNQHWNSILMGHGLNSAADIDKVFKLAASGQLNVPPDQQQMLLTQLQVSRKQLEEDAKSKLFQPREVRVKNLDGSYSTKVTDLATMAYGSRENAVKELNASLGNWDAATDLVTNEKYGLFGATLRMNQSILENAKHGLLTDKDVGQWLQNLDALQKISPQYAEKYFSQLMAADVDNNIKSYIAKQVSSVLTQPQWAQSGIATTFKKLNEEAQAKGLKYETYSQYVKAMEGIWSNDPDITPEQRKMLAIALFDPQNKGMFRQYQQDQIKDGRRIPGAQTLYARMTQEDAVNNMKKLADPVHWQNYVSTMGSEYHDMVTKELGDLNKLIEPGNKGALYVSWDNAASRWRLHQRGDATGRNILYDDHISPSAINRGNSIGALEPYFQQVKGSLQRLNTVTGGLVNIAKANGDNPSATVLQHMMTSGMTFDPRKPPEGMPGQIIQSVLRAQQAAAPPAPGWYDKGGGPAVVPLQYGPGGPQDVSGSLDEFLRNPGRKNNIELNRDYDDLGGTRRAPKARPGQPIMDPGGQGRDVRISDRKSNLGNISDAIVGPPVNIPDERTPETERMMRGLPPR